MRNPVDWIRTVVFDGSETTSAWTEKNRRKKRNSPIAGDGGMEE